MPQDSAVATEAWTAYEAAVRAASVWWPAYRDGERLSAKELAGLALSGSKKWTPPRQAAFENLVGMSFDLALDEADVDIRVRGPLRWRVGSVAADAAVAKPWIALPAGALRLVGEVEHGGRGVFLVENSDTFERVCAIPEVTSQWLCIWGKGYVTNKLVALLEWMRPERMAIWGDLDADGIAIIDDLSRRLDRKVHPVGMEWRCGVPAPTGIRSRSSIRKRARWRRGWRRRGRWSCGPWRRRSRSRANRVSRSRCTGRCCLAWLGCWRRCRPVGEQLAFGDGDREDLGCSAYSYTAHGDWDRRLTKSEKAAPRTRGQRMGREEFPAWPGLQQQRREAERKEPHDASISCAALPKAV
ncbi:Wadjet anti-phage system protein JetD domain-containing protein [Streptomyces sp. NPDC090798]|uniref:Wadjet anti-phage system protein JetD domain-containing protein n=1 Tax=Streptomyces sp. NPDC090798 TaxID=3365968 RepID=UPI00380825AE